jgi:hypothetical protein
MFSFFCRYNLTLQLSEPVPNDVDLGIDTHLFSHMNPTSPLYFEG